LERNILVAVDDSIHTRTCLSYLKTLFPRIPDLSMTLFHVQPAISDFLLEAAKKNSNEKQALDRLLERNQLESLRILERCRDRLVRSGIPEERVEIRTSQKRAGLAKDIIENGVEGLFDAILAGRRGLSGLRKWVMGSVSSNLAEHSPIPLWLVAGKSFNNRILAAVDGSASALKALEHALFMVGENPSVRITLFHVRPKLRDYCVIDFIADAESPERMVQEGNRMCLDNFYGKLRLKLQEYGVDENRIDYVEVDRKLAVAQTILNAAREHDYGTLVIGRRGTEGAVFMGRVSNYILKHSTDRAVWMVP